ncbi:MAG: ankyrin repeat domain-containing protein [bacterium]
MNLGKKTIAIISFCLLTNLAIPTQSKANALVDLATDHKIATGLISGTSLVIGTGLYKLVTFAIKQTMNIALEDAAIKGDIEEIKRLLKSRWIDVNNTEDDNNYTPLHKAAFGGNIDVVKLLIDSGANIHAETYDGKTPLWEAVLNNNYEIANYLIEKGADVNAQGNPEGRHFDMFELNSLSTPLHIASINGYLDIAQLLIKNGATINIKNRYGNTPLHYAAQNGKFDIAKLLIGNSADINALNNKKKTPLDMASDGASNFENFYKDSDFKRKDQLILKGLNNYKDVSDFLVKNGAISNIKVD